MSLSRRQMMTGAIAAPIALKFAILPARAKTAAATSQVVALQRLKAGNATVTAISDGFVPIDVSLLTNVSAEEANRLLADQFTKPSPVVTGVNAYLVQSGASNVLIDAGGAGFAPDMGKLLFGLEAAGVAPADIGTILLTHLHVDHIGALVTNGQPTFANAVVHVHEKDVAFFISAENRAAAPEGFRGFFDRAKEVVDVYRNRLKTFSGEIDIVPGIRARELFGHTPGHCGFVIGDGDEALFVWGDIVHVAAVQMAKPDVGIAFDVDDAAAAATRQRVLAEVAEARTRIAGMHIAFPGIGYVAGLPDGEAYDFKPSPWTYTLD